MNVVRTAMLSSFEKDAIKNSILDIIDESNQNTTITVKTLTSSTFNADTGQNARTETSDTIKAVSRIMSEKEVSLSPGYMQVGDREYVFDQDDVTNVPDKNTRIVEGSDTLNVVFIESDPLDIVWRVIARLV